MSTTLLFLKFPRYHWCPSLPFSPPLFLHLSFIYPLYVYLFIFFSTYLYPSISLSLYFYTCLILCPRDFVLSPLTLDILPRYLPFYISLLVFALSLFSLYLYFCLYLPVSLSFVTSSISLSYHLSLYLGPVHFRYFVKYHQQI